MLRALTWIKKKAYDEAHPVGRSLAWGVALAAIAACPALAWIPVVAAGAVVATEGGAEAVRAVRKRREQAERKAAREKAEREYAERKDKESREARLAAVLEVINRPTKEELAAEAERQFQAEVALINASSMEEEDKVAHVNRQRDILDAVLKEILRPGSGLARPARLSRLGS